MILIIALAALTGIVLLLNEYGWADLTGGERNNLVFEERNRSYGAYEIRQKYSNRLLVAVVGVMGLMSIAAVSPQFLMRSKPVAALPGHTDGPQLKITDITTPKEEPKKEIKENKVTKPSAPAPAAPKNTFVKPVVSDKPVEKKDSSDTNKPIVTDGSAKGDSTLANNGTPGGPTGTGGNGNGNTPCIDCPPSGPLDPPMVDEMAELKDYQRILIKSIHIPQRYLDMGGTGGKLYVSFVVDENGNVSAATIKRGLDSELDAEVRRAVNAMPRWKPAKLQGKNVPVRMVVPINIKIKD